MTREPGSGVLTTADPIETGAAPQRRVHAVEGRT